jgi:hypothetical protein
MQEKVAAESGNGSITVKICFQCADLWRGTASRSLRIHLLSRSLDNADDTFPPSPSITPYPPSPPIATTSTTPPQYTALTPAGILAIASPIKIESPFEGGSESYLMER